MHNVIDLDNMTDAEIGALVRNYMKSALAQPVVDARPEVLAERKQREAAAVAEVVAEQEARVERFYAGFEIATKTGTKEVPDLDIRNVSTLQEMPSAKSRSPYNRVLCGLGETILDKDTCTYATLAETHQRLAGLAGLAPVVEPVAPVTEVVAEVVADKPAKAKKGKKKKAKAAEPETLDPKVQTLVDLLGITPDQAKARIAALV